MEENLAKGFRISGLGQLVESGIQADRLVKGYNGRPVVDGVEIGPGRQPQWQDEDTIIALAPIEGVGWYVSGAWAITGDAKEEGLANTKNPIGKGIGAIEVAARLEALAVPGGILISESVATSGW